MDFQPTEEQRAIQETARAFAESEFKPHAARWDEECIFPVDALRAAAALGFAGIYLAEEVGGSGLKRLDAALIFEELASRLRLDRGLSLDPQHGGVDDRSFRRRGAAPPLPAEARADGALRQLLPDRARCRLGRGRAEDARAREGDHYVIDGAKAFISGGGASDVYVVHGAHRRRRARRASPAIVVEKGTPGLSFGKKEKKLGWNSQPTAMVTFENCRVPVANRLGEEGDGFKIAMMGLDGGRLNIAACSLGGARAALEAARAYVGERAQFGQKLAEFQALQFRLADMATELDAARLMVWRAAASLDGADPEATLHCAMAKRFATDAGFQICNEALQLHGGYGYLKDFPVERYLRDVRVHQILEGTNEIMRVIIARRLLAASNRVP